MSSTQGTESIGSGFGRATMKQLDKRSKRHMSPDEEEVLLLSLKFLIADGWKSDNGFRGGYLNKLEKLMKEKIPNTDVKAIPHLHSKIQTWKKWYNSLTTMLARSGVGFKDNMIDCSPEMWEEIIKADANAKAMRRKSWPMFEAWKEIFGKDRATGDHAEDVLDAVNDLINQESQPQDEYPTDYHVDLDQVDDNNMWADSVSGSENGAGKTGVCGDESGEAVSKGSSKKRKGRTQDSVVDVLREIGRNTNARLDTIASRIGYDYDLDEAKKEAFSLTKNIPGLSLNQRFEISEILVFKTEHLLIFKGLPEDARPHYVQRLLKNKQTTMVNNGQS